MESFNIHIKKNVGLYLLIALFGFFFFFRLDYNTLASWDEAWYGSIAREMARSGDYFHMKWNSLPYYDHPPMGFWLMAISYKIFGINELATRLPSTVLGLSSVVLMYLTGILISGKKRIGFAAALILGTSVWYLIRVRSGNLDSDFVFFYILTIYASIKSKKNPKFYILAAGSAAYLFLTKTLVGVSVVPLMIFLALPEIISKKRLKWIVLGLLISFIIIFPWYYLSYIKYPDFIEHHFFRIGSRGKSFWSYFHYYWQQPLFYIHMGIRKWYYLWFLGLIGLIFAILVKKKRYWPIFLLLWNLVILYPFLTAKETELWHLIPVYVPISLIIAVGLEELNPLGALPYLIAIMIVAGLQIKTFYKEVIPANKYTPDDVAICKAAAKYDKQIFLDDDFLPICVFYSDKKILPIFTLGTFGEPPEIDTMVKLFRSDKKDFIVITRSWAVNNLEVEKISHKILEKNGSFTIVSR